MTSQVFFCNTSFIFNQNSSNTLDCNTVVSLLFERIRSSSQTSKTSAIRDKEGRNRHSCRA